MPVSYGIYEETRRGGGLGEMTKTRGQDRTGRSMRIAVNDTEMGMVRFRALTMCFREPMPGMRASSIRVGLSAKNGIVPK